MEDIKEMLTVDEINYIRSEIQHKGKSYADVSRRTERDPRTIKKYAEQEDFSPKPKIKQVRTKKVMNEYIPLLDQWIKEDSLKNRKFRRTAKRMYTLLVEEHNFTGSERTVRHYVSLRKSVLLEEATTAALPLETKVGHAQVDFGEAPFKYNGETIKLPFLVFSFPHSNAFYFQVFMSQNRECFLEGLSRFFQKVGGVPKAIRFDNLSPVVKKVLPNGERELTEEFKKFVNHYNFICEFCNPNSGNEKGHVESMVRYVRNNFLLPELLLRDIESLNESLWKQAEKDRQRKHYEKDTLIAELYLADQNACLQLPAKSFECSRYTEVKADKYGFIRVDNKIYSTSPRFAKQKVLAKITFNQVALYDRENQLIIEHKRLYLKNKKSIIWEPYLSLMAKRPTAIKYTSFYDQLPSIWQEYFDTCTVAEKQKGLQLLSVLLKEQNFELANRALEIASQTNHPSVDSIKQIYYQLVNGRGIRDTIKVTDKVPTVPSVIRGSSQYDQLYSDVQGESK